MNHTANRSCRGKVRHKTHGSAQIAMRVSSQHHGDLTLIVYKCRHCGGFHVGHPRKVAQRALHYDRLLRLIDKANGR